MCLPFLPRYPGNGLSLTLASLDRLHADRKTRDQEPEGFPLTVTTASGRIAQRDRTCTREYRDKPLRSWFKFEDKK